ncbi:hypothetical protein IEQ34_023195 [Dendrobium chrysotoxum]|uniref:Uncharacterized protein n=1 Tax=Dendrobium chrysotoxum TaxID=161865 RepID=A0AAV7FVQ3_DENCH|nr:hypothetical protein IEQ34_023195 [Dendrobium chrysotoxum]
MSSPSSPRKNRRAVQTAESAASLTSALRSNADSQASFQSDFSSRIWCTYRSHFTPIARDGTISTQAENAAAMAAAAAAISSSQEQEQEQEPAKFTPRKNLNEDPHDSGLSSVSPSRNPHHLTTPQPSLSHAFGISTPISSSPSSSGQVGGGGGGGIGLGERMEYQTCGIVPLRLRRRMDWQDDLV